MALQDDSRAPVDPELSALAADAAEELGVVGAQVAVLHRGELSTGVTGVESILTRSPVGPETLFQIGSTTKVHVAALVMQFADEGRIGLDTPVSEQLPGFELSDRQATESVTPRHLMSMSSGIDNGPYTDLGWGDDALTRYVENLRRIPQLFPPGQSFGYSNASTCVSGRLIEHVTGQTWEEALRSRVLEPAGLHESVFFPEEVIMRRHAIGHQRDEQGEVGLTRAWSISRGLGPAGALCTSAADLARFGHLFLHSGRSMDWKEIISAEAAATMQKHEVVVPPTRLAEWWGLGPYGKVWDGVEIMGHSGTNLSGSSYLLWAAERDIAVATTVNTPKLGYPFAARMFRELFGSKAGIKVPSPPPPPDAEVEIDAERLVGTYTMSGTTFIVTERDGTLWIERRCTKDGYDPDLPPSALRPLTATTFLPTNPEIDGRRGWALVFLGPEDGPATHLLNGFFSLRRAHDRSRPSDQ